LANLESAPEFVLEHPCGLRIEKGLLESDASAVDGVVVRNMKTGYVWYDLPETRIAGKPVVVGLCFFKRTLDSVVFAIPDPLYGASWDDWSESKERARAEATRNWLRSLGYPVGEYRWGIVYAEYDPRSGGGSGGVRFAT
jgi:hypothetical protein